MLAVSLPQSQTSFSAGTFLSSIDRQTGHVTFFEISIVVKYISLKSQTMSFPFKGEPIPVRILMASKACIEPIIPGVAPTTPRVSQVINSSSDTLGKRHLRHPVSGGEKTERLPSKPIA